MPPYDDPDRITFNLGEIDFGAGGEVTSIRGPAGKQGKLVDIVVSATETFNEVTTDAE